MKERPTVLATVLLSSLMLSAQLEPPPPDRPPAPSAARPAAPRTGGAPANSPDAKSDKKDDREKDAIDEEKPVVTHHDISMAGMPLKYTVTTGMMPMKSPTGDVDAKIFYMAYTADNAGKAGKRPLMFSFNGGPGSSSVWLHMGAL